MSTSTRVLRTWFMGEEMLPHVQLIFPLCPSDRDMEGRCTVALNMVACVDLAFAFSFARKLQSRCSVLVACRSTVHHHDQCVLSLVSLSYRTLPFLMSACHCVIHAFFQFEGARSWTYTLPTRRTQNKAGDNSSCSVRVTVFLVSRTDPSLSQTALVPSGCCRKAFACR